MAVYFKLAGGGLPILSKSSSDRDFKVYIKAEIAKRNLGLRTFQMVDAGQGEGDFSN